MSKYNEKTRGVSEFFSGKGFYIILILCVAAIGVSGYVLFFTGNDGPSAETAGTELVAVPDDSARDYVNSAVRDELGAAAGNIYDAYDLPEPVTAPESLMVSPSASPKPSASPEAKPGAKTEKPATDKKTPSGADEPAAKTAAVGGSFIWPLNGKVSQAFSKDELVFNSTLDDWRVHTGVDIEAPSGAKVAAISSGTVEDVYDSELMGTTVIIDHGNELKSVYSNLMAKPTVKKGDKVSPGDIIGGVGDTAIGETAQTSHIHLEVIRDGAQIDPETVLPKKQP